MLQAFTRTALFVAVATAGLVAAMAVAVPLAASTGGTVADIPADYLPKYQAAASRCPGLSWSVLAAIGKLESDHGRSRLPGVRSGANSAGARGPMQFLPATFAAYDHPIPPGGARPPSPYNAHDAIHAASNYLCASGAQNSTDLRGAIWAYNHSTAYVNSVLTKAAAYRAAAGT
jgi:hypothetical protein